MNVLNIDKCPLCGKTQFSKVITCRDYYATGDTFDVFRCKECGFIFTQNAPDESIIGRYYESPDYISHTDTAKGIINSLYHWIRKYMLNRKAQLICHSSNVKQGKLLDIGTGTGYFSHAMQERGWKVSAIEKSPQARAFALHHFNLHVSPPETLNEYPKETFDVITLWHVLEHLQQLNATWNQLSLLLRKEGTLVVAVPNPCSFDAKKYGKYWAAYDTPRHLWHFTPSVMQQFGIRHGFKLAEIHPMPFDAFYISLLSEKYKNSKLAFAKGIWSGIEAWFASLKRKEKSSSLIYIFRKK